MPMLGCWCTWAIILSASAALGWPAVEEEEVAVEVPPGRDTVLAWLPSGMAEVWHCCSWASASAISFSSSPSSTPFLPSPKSSVS